jgi:hypothetical protein
MYKSIQKFIMDKWSIIKISDKKRNLFDRWWKFWRRAWYYKAIIRIVWIYKIGEWNII